MIKRYDVNNVAELTSYVISSMRRRIMSSDDNLPLRMPARRVNGIIARDA